MNHVSIRKVGPTDADFINQLWAGVTDEDLDRLGELKRPDPHKNTSFLNWFCSRPHNPKNTIEDIRIWCLNEEPIGYSTLKEIQYGVEGQIHLHMTRPHWRRGLGSMFFCLSARDFIEAYQLKHLFCQPKADNPLPNGMLTKVGFKMIGPIDFQRSDGAIIRQNRYLIDNGTIDRFLKEANG